MWPRPCCRSRLVRGNGCREASREAIPLVYCLSRKVANEQARLKWLFWQSGPPIRRAGFHPSIAHRVGSVGIHRRRPDGEQTKSSLSAGGAHGFLFLCGHLRELGFLVGIAVIALFVLWLAWAARCTRAPDGFRTASACGNHCDGVVARR